MFFTSPPFILAAVFVFVFYMAGKEEAKNGKADPGKWWALFSAMGSGLVIHLLPGQWLPVVLVQVGLFVAIGVIRSVLSRG